MDEVFTWQLVTDPCLRHMISAIADASDGAPPLYHTCLWLWSRAVGTSDLSLRLFSATCIAGAALATFDALRTRWSTPIAWVACWSAFFSCGLVAVHNLEARFYGLLLFITALALRQSSLVNPLPSGPLRLIVAGVVHAALAWTHLFGLLYSGFLVAVEALLGPTSRPDRLRRFAAATCGWATFLIWWGPLQNQMATAKPHFWIPMPTLGDSLLAFGNGMAFPLTLVPFLLVWWPKPGKRHRARNIRLEISALDVLSASWAFGVPLLLVAFSCLIFPVYLPRYTIPGLLGVAILLARFGDWLARDHQTETAESPSRQRMLFLGMLPVLAFFLPSGLKLRYEDPIAAQLASAPPDLPIVAENAFQYLHAWRYHRNREVWYPLDKESAVTSPCAGELTYWYLLSAIRRNYLEHRIESWDAIIYRWPQFVVIRSPLQPLNWYATRVELDPRFVVEELDNFVVKVTRVNPPRLADGYRHQVKTPNGYRTMPPSPDTGQDHMAQAPRSDTPSPQNPQSQPSGK